MTLAGKKLLGDILIERGVVSAEVVEEALNIQRRRGGALGQILLEMGKLTQEDVLRAVGEQYGMEAVDLDALEIPAEIIGLVPVSVASVYKMIPFRLDEDGALGMAMADPLNIASVDEVGFMLNRRVVGAISDPEAVGRALSKYYAAATDNLDGVLNELEEVGEIVHTDDSTTHTIDVDSLQEAADSAPVRRLIDLVLVSAIKDKASDIHFEPFEDEYKIRYRIDGVLYEMVPPPKHLSMAIASRIKVMANLNIAERRKPQGGRIQLNVGGNPIDLRVSTLPTSFGESVVLRVLDRSNVQLDLERLGMTPSDLQVYRSQATKPNGIILVTGPTSSGKTTTLYATLNELNDIGVKIITTEDPIEYDLDGIVQVEVNPDIGVTFAECLRHILRQDPDKILVGEIRDLETAEIAVQASLTGHIVFSTLHTTDAPTTVTRLVDMGIEPYLITATLECIVAQRLVRLICAKCKTEYDPTPEMLIQLNLKPEDVSGRIFYYGKGCSECNSTGYKGRMGIYEMLVLNDEMRDLIMGQASTSQLREAAIRGGMKTLRSAGLEAIYNGHTTIEEVVKATVVE